MPLGYLVFSIYDSKVLSFFRCYFDDGIVLNGKRTFNTGERKHI